jgi:hypothetical protein
MLTRRGAVCGAGAALFTISVPRPVHAAQPRLEIVESKICRGTTPVRLLGVGVGDPIYIRRHRPLSDYAVIAQGWGANTVRISLHPGHWRSGRDTALRRLVENIEAARAAGLFVIVDWHAIGFPWGYAARPDPAWGLPVDAYESDLSLAMEFWAEMARGFGRDPGVLFELWNEPVVDPLLWVSTGQHWPLLKDVWLRLIEVIRRYSDTIVLASGGRWAHDLKGVARNLIEDDRVCYAWHSYPPEDKGRQDRWFVSLEDLPKLRPIVVTEWGFCRVCDRHTRGAPDDFGIPFVRDVLEGLDLHSTAWCWSNGAAPAMLQSDWSGVTEYGRFVRQYMATANRPRAHGAMLEKTETTP